MGLGARASSGGSSVGEPPPSPPARRGARTSDRARSTLPPHLAHVHTPPLHPPPPPPPPTPQQELSLSHNPRMIGPLSSDGSTSGVCSLTNVRACVRAPPPPACQPASLPHTPTHPQHAPTHPLAPTRRRSSCWTCAPLAPLAPCPPACLSRRLHCTRSAPEATRWTGSSPPALALLASWLCWT